MNLWSFRIFKRGKSADNNNVVFIIAISLSSREIYIVQVYNLGNKVLFLCWIKSWIYFLASIVWFSGYDEFSRLQVFWFCLDGASGSKSFGVIIFLCRVEIAIIIIVIIFLCSMPRQETTQLMIHYVWSFHMWHLSSAHSLIEAALFFLL